MTQEPPHDKSTAELRREKLIAETRLIELQIEQHEFHHSRSPIYGLIDQASAERIETLENLIADLRRRMNDLMGERDVARRAEDKLKAVIDERDACLETLGTKIREMTPELNERRRQVTELRSQICELADSLANAKANAAALKEYNAQTSAQLDIARSAARFRASAIRLVAPGAEFKTYDFDQTP